MDEKVMKRYFPVVIGLDDRTRKTLASKHMKEHYISPLEDRIPYFSGDSTAPVYARVVFYCPNCGAFLTSYKEGGPWCENGLYSCERRDCKCGQKIDYYKIPYANT